MLRLRPLPLATRLSVFFLTMIGLVLIGFSATFYYVAGEFLQRQVEDQATATINALTAAVEIVPQGVEWESTGRALSFGSSPLSNDIVWYVTSQSGDVVDQSGEPDDSNFKLVFSTFPFQPQSETKLFLRKENNWQIAERWITSRSDNVPFEGVASHEDEIHSALCLHAAVLLEPADIIRRRIAITLISLSVCVWLSACLSAKFVCVRALRPLREMTAATQQINADCFSDRLPILQTRDEPAELTLAFNSLMNRLQDSFMRQQRFTGDASHQLRTPLAAILGQIEVALRRDRSAEEYRRILSLVRERATHLRNIVESLLFLARADGDAHTPVFQTIELNSFLQTFVATYSEHARFTDLKCEFSGFEECHVASHPTLLHELLSILIDNAFKFSLPGTPVTLQFQTVPEEAIIRICDGGTGIDASDLPRLGESFFRAENAKQHGIPGIGLGLSIARRLGITLQASIAFASEIGHGTQVTVRVPRSTQVALQKMFESSVQQNIVPWGNVENCTDGFGTRH